MLGKQARRVHSSSRAASRSCVMLGNMIKERPALFAVLRELDLRTTAPM
jgi:hypothetical protein